ncbi:hypothetical protein HanIR_Chr12g0571141 [Helianthus annuus]|nr:hypothetical protein HanIR_Chr12g0571141 [Helianthus annuus]
MTKFQKQLFVSLCSLFSYKRYPQIIDKKIQKQLFQYLFNQLVHRCDRLHRQIHLEVHINGR